MLSFCFYFVILFTVNISFAGDVFSNHHYEIAFNYPGSLFGENRTDPELQDRIVSLLRATPSGSKVFGATRSVKHKRIAKELIKAKKRGVDVRFILAEDDESSDSRLLKAGLGESLIICSRHIKSHRGCIGSGKNHNKFFLFSELNDGSTNIVLQSSSNLDRQTKFQNHLIFKHDPLVYSAYLNYWHDLARLEQDDHYYQTAIGSRDEILMHFSPRNDGGDSYEEHLGLIECADGSRIDIAMAHFTDSRIWKKLALKASEGCDVNILTRDDPRNKKLIRWYKKTKLEKLKLWTLPELHSKYVLVDSPYASSSSPQKIVFTGSYNFTPSAREHNDEVFIRIMDKFVFESYGHNWNRLKQYAKRI